jgi:ribosomal-protein-alanine N-acetyltransferase
MRAQARGELVFLRRPQPSDRREFLAVMRGGRRHFSHFGRPPQDAAAWRRWSATTDGRKPYLICRCADGVIVGGITVGGIQRGLFQSAYTGYFLSPRHTGQGYMTEALGLLLRVVFRRLKLHRLEANIQPDNVRSIALVQRWRFRQEGFTPRMLKTGGRWRDHERWAITIEEWAPSMRPVRRRGRR